MGNPNWKPGVSGNPAGAPKKMRKSARTVAGMIERFISRNASPHRMQKLYDSLGAKDQLQIITELMPYVLPKQSQVNVKQQLANAPDDVINELYARIIGQTQDIGFEEIIALPEPKTRL